ncbi:tetratricopeptide repeat protein [Geomobilimonas luticola]|uniref:Tetratricopeptide repeat protein n=1 Tax=Geomobilimonas luticola TaxID=1114878 RepID=A0ABS5SCH8_9BACT|nr:tetratricopeptide repeat protein [Geomobilimonas luticola]MBT0653073.1 hypothetical protein [Geomobilimonas luticola]
MRITLWILLVSLCCLTLTPQRVSAQVVPDAARRHMDRSQAALEMAKSPADLEDAVRELQKAVELAPDWADPYYSLGILQNRLERFDDALKNLARYLQLAPNARNAQEVKQLINKIEYRKEKTEKDRKDPNSLVGTWWVNGETNEGPGLFYRIEIRNINGKVMGGLREFSVTEEQRLNCGPQFGNIEWDGTSLVIPGTYYFYCDKSVQLNCCPAPARLSLTMVAKDTLKGTLRIAPYKHRDGTRNPEWTEEFAWKRVK